MSFLKRDKFKFQSGIVGIANRNLAQMKCQHNLETLEEFMLRKIQHTKNLYLKEKKLPTRLQFKVRATLRNKTSADSKRIQKAIDQAMISLHSNYFNQDRSNGLEISSK
jgi:hypothetical protein